MEVPVINELNVDTINTALQAIIREINALKKEVEALKSKVD